MSRLIFARLNSTVAQSNRRSHAQTQDIHVQLEASTPTNVKLGSFVLDTVNHAQPEFGAILLETDSPAQPPSTAPVEQLRKPSVLVVIGVPEKWAW